MTHCRKPCHFKQYTFFKDKITSFDDVEANHIWIGFTPAYLGIKVEREIQAYPWTSLVADFGGTFSLFLGISFMTLWDGIAIATGNIWTILRANKS